LTSSQFERGRLPTARWSLTPFSPSLLSPQNRIPAKRTSGFYPVQISVRYRHQAAGTLIVLFTSDTETATWQFAVFCPLLSQVYDTVVLAYREEVVARVTCARAGRRRFA
jgi:hypothetical protein